jgi:hypothetical protein
MSEGAVAGDTLDARVLKPEFSMTATEGSLAGDSLEAEVVKSFLVDTQESVSAGDAFVADVIKAAVPPDLPKYDSRTFLGMTDAVMGVGGGGGGILRPDKPSKKKKIKLHFAFLGDIYEYQREYDPEIDIALRGTPELLVSHKKPVITLEFKTV